MRESARGVRLGRRMTPSLVAPPELFELYQPLLGPEPIMYWMNLKWEALVAEEGGAVSPQLKERWMQGFRDPKRAVDALLSHGLLEIAEDGAFVVHDPLRADAFMSRFGQSAAALERSEAAAAEEKRPSEQEAVRLAEGTTGTAGLPARAEAGKDASKPSRVAYLDARRKRSKADMDAVVQIYHKRIGMLGPVQFEKLQFWVEEKGMDGEVVALAVEETARSAPTPRIAYLEGILRNWYNDGIRTLKDVAEHKSASQVLRPAQRGGKEEQKAEGMPNAAAYRRVDPAEVAKWKELYPDEYDDP